MKIKSLIFSVAALVLCVAACKKEDAAPVVTPSLSVSGLADNKISTGTDGGSATFTVTANVDWSVASNADWVSVNPASEKISGGTEKATVVTVTVQKSADGKARVAELTVSADKVSPVKISVSQSEKIDVVCKADVTDIPVSGDGGEFTVKVTANNSWAFKAVSSDWVSVEPQSKEIALGTSTETAVKVKVQKNEGAEARSEKLVIECEGAKNVEINVTQESGACYVTVYDSNLEEVSSVSFPFKGGKKTIVVDTDAASAPEIERSADWLGVTFADDFVPGEYWNCEIITGANPTGEAREGTIKFKVKGAEAVVTVKQEKGVSLSVSVSNITYQTADVTVTPSSEDFTYYTVLFDDEYYQERIAQYSNEQILFLVAKSNAQRYEMTLEEFLSKVLKTGVYTYNYSGLDPEVKHTGICAGMLTDGSVITECKTFEFTTEKKPEADAAYTDILGTWKFKGNSATYDQKIGGFAYGTNDISWTATVEEGVVNEYFLVSFQNKSEGVSPISGTYFDRYYVGYVPQNAGKAALEWYLYVPGDLGGWSFQGIDNEYCDMIWIAFDTNTLNSLDNDYIKFAWDESKSAMVPTEPQPGSFVMSTYVVGEDTQEFYGYYSGYVVPTTFEKVSAPAAKSSIRDIRNFLSNNEIKALSPKKKFNCVEKCFENKSFKVRNVR